MQTQFPFFAETEQSTPRLTANSSLKAAIGAFKKHMEYEGFSPHTIQAFTSDLNLLGKYLGMGVSIGEVSNQRLNEFLDWMATERRVPCSPKTYSRRVTTCKVFFKWLHAGGVLPADPAAAIIQRSVRSPLPTVLTAEEVERLLAAAERVRQGEEGKPDARPLLLLRLLLQTGIKKGEAAGIVPNHMDRINPQNPVLFVRYGSPSKRYKERKIRLEADWLPILDEYLEQYDTRERLFTCTPRNLEYVLHDLQELAQVEKPVSFECLRWTSVVHDYMDGTEPQELRERMGLSKVTFRETLSRIKQLAEALSQSPPPVGGHSTDRWPPAGISDWATSRTPD